MALSLRYANNLKISENKKNSFKIGIGLVKATVYFFNTWNSLIIVGGSFQTTDETHETGA